MKADEKREILSKTKIDFYRQVKLYQSTLKPTKEIEGVGSALIVGEKSYPSLKMHSVSTKDRENSFLKSGEVVKKDYFDIFRLKAKNILGSTDNSHIRKVDLRIKKEISDIYKSKSEIEFTSEFERELKFDKVVLNKVSGIVGSKNPLLSLLANENTKTSKQIEKYTEHDVKAKDALISLYERGINESQIIHLLSLGEFGINVNRKLVPTRWAITAYDKCIENYLHKRIVGYNVIKNYEICYYKNKSDTHVIIFIPDFYRAEHIEDWEGKVGRDYVSFDNKLKSNEPNNAGGYYATKIGVNEFLDKRKKQAGFIAIRIIRDYEVPLGVVFVRECVRECLKNKVFESYDLNEIHKYLRENYPVFYNHFVKSKVLNEIGKQSRLDEFF